MVIQSRVFKMVTRPNNLPSFKKIFVIIFNKKETKLKYSILLTHIKNIHCTFKEYMRKVHSIRQTKRIQENKICLNIYMFKWKKRIQNSNIYLKENYCLIYVQIE